MIATFVQSLYCSQKLFPKRTLLWLYRRQGMSRASRVAMTALFSDPRTTKGVSDPAAVEDEERRRRVKRVVVESFRWVVGRPASTDGEGHQKSLVDSLRRPGLGQPPHVLPNTGPPWTAISTASESPPGPHRPRRQRQCDVETLPKVVRHCLSEEPSDETLAQALASCHNQRAKMGTLTSSVGEAMFTVDAICLALLACESAGSLRAKRDGTILEIITIEQRIFRGTEAKAPAA